MGVDIGVCYYDKLREDKIVVLTSLRQHGYNRNEALNQLFNTNTAFIAITLDTLLEDRFQNKPELPESIRGLVGSRWENLNIHINFGVTPYDVNVAQEVILQPAIKQYLDLCLQLQRLDLNEYVKHDLEQLVEFLSYCFFHNLMLFPC